MERKFFEISWLSLWRVLFFGISVFIFYLASDIFLALFLAIVISSGLDFFIDFLEKRGLPRVLGTIFVFIVIALIIIIILYTVIPLILIDINTVYKSLSKYGLSKFIPSIFLKQPTSFGDFIDKISAQFFSDAASPLEVFGGLIGNATLFVSIIIISFYLCITKNGIERFILAVFPENIEQKALKIYNKSLIRISRWFRAQIFLSLTMFILVFITLYFLGVKNYFFLALLAGLFEIIPYVGPIIAGGAATISALTSSVSLAVYTLIIFIILQQLENHFLVPLFMKKSIDLHPVIVIVALLVGGRLGGFLGVLISVPLLVVIQEMLEEWLDKSKNIN
ncbi:MAG: AI-2E family transporter [Patescibacteria group bacterium]|nr:AI-2E family transporter [Patescibacteria group bacterium]MCX7589679.1 AI-2E family transporter [Patescibacteria group bacterium]MDW8279801.1 AI-2E family transporter [bacterium]